MFNILQTTAWQQLHCHPLPLVMQVVAVKVLPANNEQLRELLIQVGVCGSSPMTSPMLVASVQLAVDQINHCTQAQGSLARPSGRACVMEEPCFPLLNTLFWFAWFVREAVHANSSHHLPMQRASLHQFMSRDANIVQVYGACVQGSRLMVVNEFLEVGGGGVEKIGGGGGFSPLLSFKCSGAHIANAGLVAAQPPECALPCARACI